MKYGSGSNTTGPVSPVGPVGGNEIPDIPEVQEELMDNDQPTPVMPPRVESSMRDPV